MNSSDSFPDVILYTRGTKGDLYPFLSLGRGLRERGCKVTLLSNYRYESYARREQFDFAALDDEESFEFLNNMPELHSSLAAKIKLSRDHMIANLEQEVAIIRNAISRPNTVIVAHSNDYLAPMLASEKDHIALHLCMLAPSYVHGFTLFEAILKNLSNELNDIRRRIGLDPQQDWGRWLKGFGKCFAVWPDWFSDGADKIVPGLECIGFLSIDSIENLPLQKEVREFIGVDGKNILITHGTSRPFNDDYFRLSVNACRELDCHLIVSTPFRELLPVDLPANVLWIDFCAFHELLPFIDLIVHHGGIGTTREAIANATPQLIIGQGFDRQHNGRIIKKCGLGDWIMPKDLSEETLRQKLCALAGNAEIETRCAHYGPLLYNDAGLEAFYRHVMNGLDVEVSDLVDRPAAAQREARAAAGGAQETLAVDDVKRLTAGEDKAHHRQALLLRMLKAKLAN